MRNAIRFDNELHTHGNVEVGLCAPEIVEALLAIAAALNRIAAAQEGPKATTLNPSFSEEPLA